MLAGLDGPDPVSGTWTMNYVDYANLKSDI